MRQYLADQPRRRWWDLGPWELRLLCTLSMVLGLLWTSTVYSAPAWDDDQWTLYYIIQQHAAVYEVSADTMVRVATCESSMGAWNRGDNGHSHGPFQLNDRATGLLWHFYSVGYDNPYSYNQSTDYFARVLSGEWSKQGITARRWSCR